MENNIENKIKFFAQYFGQKVKRSYLPEQTGLGVVDGNCFHIQHLISNGYLELKDIQYITDEDALKCWDNDNYIAKYEDIPFTTNLFVNMSALNSDYLRSKGYAVPWMGLSVYKQVEYGWVKLKDDGEI